LTIMQIWSDDAGAKENRKPSGYCQNILPEDLGLLMVAHSPAILFLILTG